MKLRLPIMLLTALLQALPAAAGNSTYMADGVNRDDLLHSERFYDVGKGYYWQFTPNQPYKGAQELFMRDRNFSFMGDLADRISGTSFGVDAFKKLENDGNTCGYQVPANQIQYWLSYYGVFYTGEEPLAYGLSYSRDNLEKLGGTQSLDVGMLFYDSLKDTGNNLRYVGYWYFYNRDVIEALPYKTPDGGWFSRVQDGASGGGYFADYFTNPDEEIIFLNFEKDGYSNSRPRTIKSFSHELVKGFGMEEAADGSYVSTRPGQLTYIGVMVEGLNLGHALTCYGFDTDENGMVRALHVANSDDRLFQLFTLYVAENESGLLALYSDAACKNRWLYSNDEYRWYISAVEYINTPERLVDMYKLYTADDTPLTWTGQAAVWSADYTRATTDELPSAATGWDVRIADQGYHAYYSDKRRLIFDDTAVSTEVAVSGSIATAEMNLCNAEKDYLFTGAGVARILPESLVIEGTGASTFRGVSLATDSLLCEAYTLRFAEGSRLTANSGSVAQHGVLELCGGRADVTTLSFGKSATLRVSAASAFGGALTLQDGSVFDCSLSSANSTQALLSVSGSLTLTGTVKLEVEGSGLTEGASYLLCTVTSGSIDTTHFFTEHGSLTFSDNELRLRYHELPTYTWSSGSCAWSATAFGNRSCNTVHADVNITGGSGTITLSGQVTPHHLSISGGTYTFTGTKASIACEGYVNLSGSASLTLKVPVSSQGVLLENRAKLTLESGAAGALGYISAAAGTTLNIHGAASYLVEDAGTLAGQILVGDGTTLTFGMTHDAHLTGTVTSTTKTCALHFENRSSVRDEIVYELGYSLSGFKGSVTVGAESASGRTTLSVGLPPTSGKYTLNAGGALTIHGSGDFATDVSGSGTIIVAEGAELAVPLTDGMPGFRNTLSLDVRGSLTIGSPQSTLEGTLAQNLDVSGHMTVYMHGSTLANYDRMTFDGGSYTYVTGADPYDITTHIANLQVQAKGGSIKRLFEGSVSYGTYAGSVLVAELTGSGDLRLSGDHFLQMSYYRIDGVGAAGYTGDLHVSSTGSDAPRYNLTALELGSGTYGGAVILNCAEDSEYCRTSLGIKGDVSLRGLSSGDWGSVYLYSGELKDTNLNTVVASPSGMITPAEHTLTIDTAANKAYHFYGTVLGSGAFHLVKKGSGSQSFLGDMSGFTGSASVQAGVLEFAQGLSLTSASVARGAELRIGGQLSVSGALSMTGGSLVTSSLRTAAASFSGACTLQASSVTAAGIWDVLLTADNKEQSVLDLTSAGALNLKGLAVKYEKSSLAAGSYKILTLSSANANALEGVTLTANGSAATLGSKGSATLYLQSNAAGQYDVMMDVAGAMTAPTPSVSAASLVWQTSTGTWTVDTGSPTGVWAGNGTAANFRNGDDVTFSKAATVSVSGKVAPRSVTVNAASGTVTLKSAATGSAITGSTGVVKSGAGSLTISLANSYTGGTTIKGGTLTVGNASALGTGAVTLTAGTLNTGSYGVTNAVTAKGGTLLGSAYKGKLTIAGNVTHSGTVCGKELNLNSGTLHGNVSTRDVTVLNANGAALDGNLTLNGGTLQFGKAPLSVSGALTLSNGTTLGLASYTAAGTYTLISAGSVSGSTEMLAYNHQVGNMGYSVNMTDKALVLVVSPLSKSLTWAGAKGVWTSGCLIGGTAFEAGDTVNFRTPAAVTISGQVAPGAVVVNCNLKDKVSFTADKKVPGSGISGTGSVTKCGAGTLTMNAGNTYSGGTVLNNGTLKATAADSFGTGTITLKGGTLDLGSKLVPNDIVLAGTATLKGDAKYMGNVTVEGDAALQAKSSFKGITTIAAGNSLTLAEKASMACSFVLTGGSLTITAPAGLKLAKNSTMLLRSGTVDGLLTIGSGSFLQWEDGAFTKAPILKGGTLDLFGDATLTLSGSKAGVQFGSKSVNLPGKGIVRTNEALCVTLGTVTVSALADYEKEIIVAGGTLKLATGKIPSRNDIRVIGAAAVVNGSLHSGHISVTGQLVKGTNIKLTDPAQSVTLNGEGSLAGTISGSGSVNVNASIDATAAKVTASRINLYSGTYTNTAGIKLAKGQTLALAGAKINLGTKGSLTTAAGSTLAIGAATTLTGNLTLGGGELVFTGGNLTVKGALTLSKAVTVSGTGSITYTTLNPYKGALSSFFEGADVKKSGSKLIITGTEPATLKISALATAPDAETPLSESVDYVPTDTALVPLPTADPVADAVVQADWGIIDAERAFMGAVNSRYQHAALLDKGRGAAWVSAFGSSVRHGNKGAHHGSDGNIEGAAFGLEHALSETGSIGLAVGRSKNRIAATGVTHLRQETAHVALYGQKQLAHGFTADAAASYGDTETKLGAVAWQQKSAALTARLTHAQQLTDATAFRTFGGLTYEATDSASVGTGSVQNLRAELGAGATHTSGKAHFYAEAALTGDIVRHNPTVDFGGLRLRGANPGRIGVRATIGGLYEFTDTWSGTASYSVEAESRSTAHTFNLGVSKEF